MLSYLSKLSVTAKGKGKTADSPQWAETFYFIHQLHCQLSLSLRKLWTQSHSPKFNVDHVLGPNGTLIYKACALRAELVNLLFPRLDQHPASSKNCRRKKKDIKWKLSALPVNHPQNATIEFPFATDNLPTNFFSFTQLLLSHSCHKHLPETAKTWPCTTKGNQHETLTFRSQEI